MLIACDVDGVVADTAATVLRRINAMHNLNIHPRELVEWDMRLTIARFARDVDVDAVFSAPDLYDDVQPVKGAVEAINELRERGHTFCYVTSCFTGTVEQKARWLRRGGFLHTAQRHRHLPNELIVASAKHLIAADLLIDDKPGNVIRWASHRQRPVIMPLHPFNRQYVERPQTYFTPAEWHSVYVAMTWPEIVATIERITT